MKNTFWSIFTVAACSAMTVSAIDADYAQVTLKADKPGMSGKIVSTVEAKPNTISFTEGKGKSARSWQRISLPIKVEGRAKKERGDNSAPIPDYLDGLTVTAYVLFKTADKQGKEKFAMVDKTLTYHEIALGKGKEGGECEMTVDLFLSPRNAVKISTAGPRAKTPSTAVKVVAAAIDATFGGKACMNKAESQDARFERVELPKQWWKSDKYNGGGAVLYAINETPYAAVLPASEAWVTTDAAPAVSASGTMTDALQETEGTTDLNTPADTTSGVDATADDSSTDSNADDEGESGTKPKKKKKNNTKKKSRK